VDALWLLVLGAWSAVVCVTASPHLGITYDEPFYLDAGMDSWRGWWRTDGQTPVFAHETTCACGVMPLPPDVATLPLAVYEMRTGEKLDSDGKIARILWARAMTLGWLWLLVVSAWRLGRAAGGPWGGRIASGLIAADPNFLGHAALATTDVAISASLMAFARAVYAGRGGGWWPRVVLPGLWYGVAVLCKLSGLLYGGIILVALEVCHRFASGELSRPIGGGSGAWARKFALAVVRSVLAAAAVIAIGVTLAVLFCGLPDEGSEPFKRVANAVPPDEPLRPVFRRWAEHAGRLPNAGCAFAFQWWWNARGRPTFLNGTYYPEGYRWFFPELLMMKVPIPVMAVFLLALPRPRALANPLTLAALLLFAVLTQANLQLGFRFAFPALALAYVAVAVALARGYPRCAPFLGVPAILAVAAISAWVWPHGIGYLNQLYGGPGQAHRRVTDSNLDWGQGIPELRAWHDANGSPPTVVWYFGVDPAVRKPPFQPFPLESLPIQSPEDLRKAVGPRVLAVGYTVISLHPDGPPAKVVALEYLATRRPLARTTTFVLYDFRDEANGPPPLE
jgi:hypothetical protein